MPKVIFKEDAINAFMDARGFNREQLPKVESETNIILSHRDAFRQMLRTTNYLTDDVDRLEE